MNKTITKGLKYSTVEIDDFIEKLEQYIPAQYAMIVRSMLKEESLYRQLDIFDLIPLRVDRVITRDMVEAMGAEKAEHYAKYNMCNDFALELMKNGCVTITKTPYTYTDEFKFRGDLLVGINRERLNESISGREGSNEDI